MPTRRRLILTLLAALVVLVSLGSALLLFPPGREGPAVSGQALVGGPFTLTAHDGRRMSDTDFRGKYMLVFFGYTFCPDVCPTELQVISAALDQMGTKADTIQPIFVTIDPARDTVDVMKSYVESFHPRLIGLTGNDSDIATIAKAYRVFYQRGGPQQGSDYLMDHTNITYLMDKDGKFLKHFTYSTDATALANALTDATGG
jgi:protein SCO1/2